MLNAWRMVFRSSAAVLILLLLVMFPILPSCGYHLSGTGDLVPKTARSIAIPVFVNGTNEPFVDVELTRAVVDEFLADGRLQVIGLEGADLALRCKVVRYEAVALSYTSFDYVQQYRIRMVVDAKLEDMREKKILWQENGIETVFISDYTVVYRDPITKETGGNIAAIEATKINKEAAIRQASRDLALTLRSRVLEGF